MTRSQPAANICRRYGLPPGPARGRRLRRSGPGWPTRPGRACARARRVRHPGDRRGQVPGSAPLPTRYRSCADPRHARCSSRRPGCPAPTERTWSGAWPTASPVDLRRRAERRMRMSGTRLPAKAPDFGDEPHDVFRCAGNEVNDLVQLDIWRRQLPVAGLHFQVHFLIGDRIISDPDEAAPAGGSAGFQLRDPWWRRCAQSSEGALLDLV